MGFPYFSIDPNGSGGVTQASGASSASFTIPAGYEYVGLVVTQPVHWRFGLPGATPVAVATDPMLTPNAEPFICKVPGFPGSNPTTTIAVIQEGVAGILSVFGIREA